MELEKWKNGANICIDNINRLIEDGMLLIQNKSYGHACFSFITALEEIGVAYLILGTFNDPKPKEFKKFLNHKKKMGISNIVNIILTGGPEGITKKLNSIINSTEFETKSKKAKMDDFLILSDEIQKNENLWFLRNAGIYVNLDSSKQDFIHPGQIGQNHALNLYKKATDAAFFLQVERDKLLKFGPTLEAELSSVNTIIKARTLFEEVGSSLLTGSIEKIQSISEVSPALKDSLTKILLESFPIVHHDLNLEINSFEEFDKIILMLVYEIFREPIQKMKDAELNPKLKEIIDFTLERWNFYSPKKGKLLASVISILKNLGSRNIELTLESMSELEKLILETEIDL